MHLRHTSTLTHMHSHTYTYKKSHTHALTQALVLHQTSLTCNWTFFFWQVWISWSLNWSCYIHFFQGIFFKLLHFAYSRVVDGKGLWECHSATVEVKCQELTLSCHREGLRDHTQVFRGWWRAFTSKPSHLALSFFLSFSTHVLPSTGSRITLLQFPSLLTKVKYRTYPSTVETWLVAALPEGQTLLLQAPAHPYTPTMGWLYPACHLFLHSTNVYGMPTVCQLLDQVVAQQKIKCEYSCSPLLKGRNGATNKHNC